MGKTLIVAEKPSQAREYARALGVKLKKDGNKNGYIESDKYVITWCYGHLLELDRPEAYMDLERVGKRWGIKRLPVLPGLDAFRRVVKSETSKQFQLIQQWLKSSVIDEVICGTDADREGQLLFQEVWDASLCRKPLSRLWISSLTTAAITEGLKNLRTADSVAGLANAGHGRAFADWDFGMNLTEGFTALFGSYDAVQKRPNVISVGRVQTPTLALIVEREWEIENFVAELFFEIKAIFSSAQGDYFGKWFDPRESAKHITSIQDALEIVAKTKGKPGIITKVEAKDVQDYAPLLFDLTSLTVAASKKYGFSAEKVLQIAQSLYEKKAITYPRTDCVYLSEDILPKLPDHLKALRQEPYVNFVDEAKNWGVPSNKRVINKISAHHAIIPTTEKVVIEKLKDEEQKIYDLIVRRFLAVWFPPAVYHQTEVITEVEGEFFRTKGKVLLNLGWKRLYELDDQGEKTLPKAKKKSDRERSEDENEILPPLSQGEQVKTKNVYSEEKSTKPPKRFTQGDLLKAMESAGRKIDDEVLRQQLKGKGLGTVATRPAIIENLIERRYILQEQKILKPTQKGIELIRLIKNRLPQAQLIISAEMTGQMEFNLSRVESGDLTLEHFMTEVEKAVIGIIDELRSFEHNFGKTPLALGSSSDVKTKAATNMNHTEVLGLCPRCGGDMIEGRKGFGCANWRQGCNFVIWKKPICGKVLTRVQVKSLLKKGKTPLIKGFKAKSGKQFNAYLIWDDKVEAKLKFEYQSR